MYWSVLVNAHLNWSLYYFRNAYLLVTLIVYQFLFFFVFNNMVFDCGDFYCLFSFLKRVKYTEYRLKTRQFYLEETQREIQNIEIYFHFIRFTLFEEMYTRVVCMEPLSPYQYHLLCDRETRSETWYKIYSVKNIRRSNFVDQLET